MHVAILIYLIGSTSPFLTVTALEAPDSSARTQGFCLVPRCQPLFMHSDRLYNYENPIVRHAATEKVPQVGNRKRPWIQQSSCCCSTFEIRLSPCPTFSEHEAPTSQLDVAILRNSAPLVQTGPCQNCPTPLSYLSRPDSPP